MKLELNQLIIKHVTYVCACVYVCVYVYTDAHRWVDAGKHCMCRRVGAHTYAWTGTHQHVNIKRFTGNTIVAEETHVRAAQQVQSLVCFHCVFIRRSLCFFSPLSLYVSTSLSFPVGPSFFLQSTDLAVHLQYFKPVSQAFHTSLMSSQGDVTWLWRQVPTASQKISIQLLASNCQASGKSL